MKKILPAALALLLFFPALRLQAQRPAEETIETKALRIRDPFVFPDRRSGCYYMPANSGRGTLTLYKSRDLQTWTRSECFVPEKDFWGKTDFWAPDLYAYKGKYYIFATFSDAGKMRGTGILTADRPEGPYVPLVNGPATPAGWMALDGALFTAGKNTPWIIYCHEWLQVGDGEIAAQRLSADLTEPLGEPIVLFKASEAPWTQAFESGGRDGNYITDAPFIYKMKGGRLLMLWSSRGKNGKYCIGASYSDHGLAGPWVHDDRPLNDDDGGHAMLFTDKSGKLKISYHSPNSARETLTIKNVVFENGKIKITE